MNDIEQRLNRLEAKVNSIIRVGVISSVDAKTGTAKVTFKELDGLVSHNLPILFQWSESSSAFEMPIVNEQVTCIFLPHATEIGFIVGSFYSKKKQAPEGAEQKRMIKFQDGTLIEYDKAAKKLLIDSKGTVEIKAAKDIKIESTANVNVIAKDVNVTASGKANVKATAIDLDGGSSDLSGVVTMMCNCAFTGAPHAIGSSNVKASKG